jgi:AbrB family looped-hinge helix DNA binding protein
MTLVKPVAYATEFTSSVSPNGQITIPLAIRERLDIKPKDKVTIRMEGEKVSIKKDIGSIEDSYQAIPRLPKDLRRLSVDELVEIAREDHARDVAREGL